MGDTWITDMRHFLDVIDPAKTAQAPLPALRLACHLGSIVEAVTAGWDDRGDLIPTVLSCRRRPGRSACKGFIGARLLVDGRIEWGCSSCDDNGVISGWKGTPWDFSSVVGLGFARGRDLAELAVSRAEYDALRRILTVDREAERVVKAARLGPEDDEVVIVAPGNWLDHLIEQVAAEANATGSRKTEALLGKVLARAEW
ncbi:MAG: hypothetical protein FJ087_03035 [Deltaproteobacteria bacterium]|nr:hypothetical protein [Deltaproteobacteria bacterium]